MPSIEMGKEPLRYGEAAPRRFRGISLLFQMFFELD